MGFTLVKNNNTGVGNYFQSDLLFHVNRMTKVRHFYIPSLVVFEVIAITHDQSIIQDSIDVARLFLNLSIFTD